MHGGDVTDWRIFGIRAKTGHSSLIYTAAKSNLSCFVWSLTAILNIFSAAAKFCPRVDLLSKAIYDNAVFPTVLQLTGLAAQQSQNPGGTTFFK